MKSERLLSTNIRFHIPYMSDAFNHLMYQDLGYRCNTSFDIDEIGRRSTDPALTASEKIQIAKDIL